MADDDDEEKKESTPPEPLGVPEWMVTYGDMMTLLLCFFVLLFIFSSTDLEKFRSVAGSIKDAFGVQTERPEAPYHAYSPAPVEGSPKALSKAESDLYSTVKDIVSDVLQKDPDLKQAMKIETTETGIMVRISNAYLFKDGLPNLTTKSSQLLRPVIEASEKSKFNILVRNNTTQNHLDKRYFISVWELSGARAAAALHGLLVYSDHRMKPSNLRAMGVGDSMPLHAWDDKQSDIENNRTEFLFFIPGKEFW